MSQVRRNQGRRAAPPLMTLESLEQRGLLSVVLPISSAHLAVSDGDGAVAEVASSAAGLKGGRVASTKPGESGLNDQTHTRRTIDGKDLTPSLSDRNNLDAAASSKRLASQDDDPREVADSVPSSSRSSSDPASPISLTDDPPAAGPQTTIGLVADAMPDSQDMASVVGSVPGSTTPAGISVVNPSGRDRRTRRSTSSHSRGTRGRRHGRGGARNGRASFMERANSDESTWWRAIATSGPGDVGS